jgi:hypothetical protein
MENISMQQLKQQRLTEEEKTNLKKLKDIFKTQIEKNGVVDKKMLSRLTTQTYENGEPIKIGDELLFALLRRSAFDVSLIALKIEHLKLYNYENVSSGNSIGYAIPLLKYK